MAILKILVSRRYRRNGGIEGRRSESRCNKAERAFWQRRFWEHQIRDTEDLQRHMDYIHYNPVKHSLTGLPKEWPWSTFQRYEKMGYYDACWGAASALDIPGAEWE